MTTETLKEKIVTLVRTTEGIDKKSISESTSAKGILLEGTLSKLIKEKVLTVQEKEGQKFYFVASENTETSVLEEKEGKDEDKTSAASEKKGSKKGKKEKAPAKSDDEREEKGEKEKTTATKGKSEGGRDMRKFRFDGEQHTKGGLVLAVVRKYVEKHKNISLTKLKEVFPDELLQRFGVVQDVKKAKTFTSGGRDRFFLKDDQLIKVQNSRIAVSNQWTSENIKPFLTAARKHFDIR